MKLKGETAAALTEITKRVNKNYVGLELQVQLFLASTMVGGEGPSVFFRRLLYTPGEPSTSTEWETGQTRESV